MKHQQAIQSQRITNLQTGIKQAECYLGGLNKMLNVENPDIASVVNEVEEIRDFLLWLSQL